MIKSPTLIRITQSTKDTDLDDILELQKQNLKEALSHEEAMREGFITVPHTYEVLSAMNKPFPHTIAKDGDVLAGYAMTMETSLRKAIPILIPMFEQIDACIVNGQPLSEVNYFVMGQVCIAKGYRGQGLFAKMYDDLCQRLSIQYDYIATEIAADNLRSQKAHAKYGFDTLSRYVADGVEWLVVGMWLPKS